MTENGASAPCLFDGKVCTKCKRWKPRDGFHSSNRYRDGRTAQCGECINNQARAHRYERLKTTYCACGRFRSEGASKCRTCSDALRVKPKNLVCKCGKAKDRRAAQCRACSNSSTASAQWKREDVREKMLTGISSDRRSRWKTFEGITLASFNERRKGDGRFLTFYRDSEGRKRTIYRYRWVWTLANGPIPEGHEVHHINLDCTDDRLENLALLTKSEHRRLHYRIDHARLVSGQRTYLSNNLSKPQRALCGYLALAGVEFTSEALIGNDLLVDALVGSLVIECDGDYWHGHARFEPLTESQLRRREADAKKDALLRAMGYTVVRIWESDMDMEAVTYALESAF